MSLEILAVALVAMLMAAGGAFFWGRSSGSKKGAKSQQEAIETAAQTMAKPPRSKNELILWLRKHRR